MGTQFAKDSQVQQREAEDLLSLHLSRIRRTMFPFSFQIFDFYIESLIDPVPGPHWTFALYSSVNINITYSPHLVQGNADSKHMSTISFKVKSSKVSDLTLP